jgi:hypothetical protein
MAENRLDIFDTILVLGVLGVTASILIWVATNCSWWHNSFCQDPAVTGTIGTIAFAIGAIGIVLFFVGGIGREIRREGRLTPGVYNEIRRQHELGSITRKPFIPNAMVLAGLIMIFGVSSTLFGTFWNWTIAGLGFVLAGVGYYLKRRHINLNRNQTTGLNPED